MADLQFDDLKRHFAGILQAVPLRGGDTDALVFAHRLFFSPTMTLAVPLTASHRGLQTTHYGANVTLSPYPVQRVERLLRPHSDWPK